MKHFKPVWLVDLDSNYFHCIEKNNTHIFQNIFCVPERKKGIQIWNNSKLWHHFWLTTSLIFEKFNISCQDKKNTNKWMISTTASQLSLRGDNKKLFPGFYLWYDFSASPFFTLPQGNIRATLRLSLPPHNFLSTHFIIAWFPWPNNLSVFKEPNLLDSESRTSSSPCQGN